MFSGGVYRYLLWGLRRARLERDNWTLFYGYCYGGRTDMGHVWSLGRCRKHFDNFLDGDVSSADHDLRIM